MRKLLLLLPFLAFDAYAAGAIRSEVTGSGGSSSQTYTVTLPATIEAGDQVVILISGDDDDDLTFDGACPFDIWLFENQRQGLVHSVTLGLFDAVGTEDSSTCDITIPTGAERAAWWIGSLSGLVDSDTTAPEATTDPSNSATQVTPSETHAGSDQGDYYVIAGVGCDNSAQTSISVYPSGYVDTVEEFEANSGGQGVAVAFSSVTSNTENPGDYTIAASEQCVAFTAMFLEEAAGSTPNVLRRRRM